MTSFTRLAGFTGLGLLSACTTLPDDALTAKKIFYNGTIYTANAAQQSVEALAIRDDKIVFVGSLAEARKQAGPDTEMIDLQGKMILPGLHDSHIHPLLALEEMTCTLPEKNEFKLKQVVQEVKACLAALGDQAPAKGTWLTVAMFNGYGADSPSYLEGYPDIASGLDDISKEHKVILVGVDGHAYAVNHYAMDKGMTLNGVHYPLTVQSLAKQFKDYAGLIGTNSEGQPDGHIRSQAAWDLFKYETTTAAQFLERQDEINDYFLSNGITSAMEAWAHQRDVDVYTGMATKGNLVPRISLSMVVQKDAHSDGHGGVDVDKFMAHMNAARKGAEGLEKLKVDSVKLMVDGVMEYPTQTAALAKPYLKMEADKNGETHYHGSDSTHDKINRGLLELPPAEVERLVGIIDKAGYSAHFHAIGDQAVHVALNAVEKARAANPDSRLPHNIAHLQLVFPEDVPRFGQLGVFATPTTAWFAPWPAYDQTVMPYISKVSNINDLDDLYRPSNDYMQRAYPIEGIRKGGGIISIGSDAPMEFKGPRPFTNIRNGLLRGEWIADPTIPKDQLKDDDYIWMVVNKKERMKIRDLLDGYTINGAKALQQDAIVGSLDAGKLAAFVVINQDIIAMAESISVDEEGNENTELAYKICDINFDEKACTTEVLQTYIDGELVFSKDPVQQRAPVL